MSPKRRGGEQVAIGSNGQVRTKRSVPTNERTGGGERGRLISVPFMALLDLHFFSLESIF